MEARAEGRTFVLCIHGQNAEGDNPQFISQTHHNILS